MARLCQVIKTSGFSDPPHAKAIFESRGRRVRISLSGIGPKVPLADIAVAGVHSPCHQPAAFCPKVFP